METKKKVFFLLYSMNVGGVEKSLVNLLSILPRERYDIHVGLVHQEGGLLAYLPSDVVIHSISDIQEHWDDLKNPPLQTIKTYAQKGQYIKVLLALIVYLTCKFQGSFMGWTQYLLKDTKGLKETFDLSVAYAGPASDIDYYICQKVQAKKKIGWIHFDISKIGVDRKMVRQLYGHYERIFVVSETSKAIFDQIFPQFKDKTEVFHNVVSSIQIKEQASIGESFEDDFDGKRILTVGRISSEKGQFMAIQALKSLKDKGYHIRWYFIGDGNDMEHCKNEVERLGLSENVFFLGTKTNPYAYMRDCDIYMQPSRHEGFCITLAEALCFGNPVVATDFTGAYEQLKDKKNGFVVGMSAKNIAEGIEKAIAAPMKICSHKVENTDIDKLLSLI